MRIVSMTGVDYPYDLLIVYRSFDRIVCRLATDVHGREWVLGTYSDEEKAGHALQIIIEAFRAGTRVVELSPEIQPHAEET